MWQTLKSVSGLGKNKSQNSQKVDSLSLNREMVTDQISIANNFNKFFTSKGQTNANNIPLSNKNLKSTL